MSLLIDNARDWWKMTSVQLQMVWGVMCATFAAMPEAQQIGLLDFLGFNGQAVLAAFVFFSQVSAGVAAATVAARLTKQASVSGGQ